MPRWIAAATLFLFALASFAAAQDVRPSRQCERAKLPGRGYIECLEKLSRETTEALDAAVERIRGQIDARSELAPVQKARWKNGLEEAHVLFIRFRNQECQSVAPYEGPNNRIGAFEERLACLVDKNTARLRDLEARYGKP
jgi:uncharacterized protein YecT (DUF1311 family)